MVAVNDLGRVTQLYEERSNLVTALEIFDAGGGIYSMRISMPLPDGEQSLPSVRNVLIPVDWMTYPPPMLDAIRAQLTQRRDAINSELAGMGIDMSSG
jgi:hypothetical protein